MSGLDHTVYVLTINKHVGGSDPKTPADILGGRFYETEREALDAIREQDLSPGYVRVRTVRLARPWVMGMAPLI